MWCLWGKNIIYKLNEKNEIIKEFLPQEGAVLMDSSQVFPVIYKIILLSPREISLEFDWNNLTDFFVFLVL